jgi:hypothetical protein
LRKNAVSANGHTQFVKDTWYEGLEMKGNTSINPFFYGTYLAETKPNEPVTRTKEEAFQADAVGAAHQLTPSHFETPHTFRVEWQPGVGGRLDWYVKNYKINDTTYIEGDGNGQEWLHAYSMQDDTIRNLMGSQIPIEPTYLIFNVAVSSTWGFPYDVPEYCSKCYDCDDPKCACSFYPGFCQMLRSGNTAMYIDNVRVYQSRDPDAHVGAHHTLGCDPPDYPTREWIVGHEYRYMRNPPFSYDDKHPLRKIRKGGGSCTSNIDCGGIAQAANLSILSETMSEEGIEAIAGATGRRQIQATSDESGDEVNTTSNPVRGECATQIQHGLFGKASSKNVCICSEGFTGPYCLSLDHKDETPKASELSKNRSPFLRISHFKVPSFMLITILSGCVILFYILLESVWQNKKFRTSTSKSPPVALNGNINNGTNPTTRN